jgi:hypothetical protein
MEKELTALIKTITALAQLTVIYLMITWSYQGLAFALRSFIG